MEQTQMFYWSLLALLAFCNADFPVVQPKPNVWVTLAKAAGSDTICLSNSNPEMPFATCLVGVPVKNWPIPIYHDPLTKKQLNSKPEVASGRNPVKDWDLWTIKLPKATAETQEEPQELEILGSLTMDFCLTFSNSNQQKKDSPRYNVTPNHPFYKSASFWCNCSGSWGGRSGVDQYPRQLPKGYWFICGDRAWQGIPSRLEGGPCSIGQLTVLAPNAKTVIRKKHRGKRSAHPYGENCNSEFRPWKTAARVSADLLVPQLASAMGLKQLDQAGCWLSKQTNATSIVISDMLTDINSVRHATLQNRAAIDFLLLAHGHGCEEFEGLCCMNLSDHSESIHKSIQKLKDLTSQIQRDSGSWLDGLFEEWSSAPWLKELCKAGLYVSMIVVVILIVVSCILQCV
ncbi:PREDICTED: uncharacterized protein LOC108445601 [Corvus brachyrhynchos]|nr:PREDICTED: uncharacterized protein LOC108445601 [Corvus brachyrhynchos]XP_017585505.1 PREDICTED: uncharacterized protein LOC108445601 [Corvus brachyrhynchos]